MAYLLFVGEDNKLARSFLVYVQLFPMAQMAK